MAHLKRHQAAVHYKIKNHQCEKCNKSFTRKEHLKIHKRTVHKERQIFKRTERKGEEKKYQCQFCKKPFDLSHVMKNHEMTHTGEKPFKCD